MLLSIAHAAEAPAGWTDFVRRHGSFYHEPSWIRAIAAAFRLRVHFLSVSADGELTAALPLAEVPRPLRRRPRLVSLPFGYAAGIVAADHGARLAVAGAARDLARAVGAARVELKGEEPVTPLLDGFERSTRYATYRLDTAGGDDAILARLHASTRRSIRKADRAPLTLDVGGGDENWRTLAALQERTAHRQGTPSPPEHFFARECARLEREGLASVYVARVQDGRPCAAVSVWRGARWWIYGFGASDPTMLEHRPNHLLLWAAARDAAAAGCGFDLGRAAPEQSSLVEFKRRWGGEPVPLAYDYWPKAGGLHAAPRDRGGLSLASRIWARLPPAVARRGSALYRYLG